MESINEVTWREIIKYPNYLVSTSGYIKNKTTNRILRPCLRNGYLSITLSIKNKKKTENIHTLVAETFLLKYNNKKYVVNHINENKEDNRLTNLEYVTYSQNTRHSSTSKRTFIDKPFDLNNFKEIPGFNKYMISIDGDIYSTLTKKLCKPTQIPSGYHKIKLLSNEGTYKDKYIHVLIAMTYLNYIPSHDMIINHKDAIKSHNTLSNIEILSKKENAKHSIEINNHRIFRKPVFYIKDGTPITFVSAKCASIETKVDHSSIIKSCKNTQLLAGGIKWYYG